MSSIQALCAHYPPGAQGSGSKITFSGLSSGEMGHKERSNAPAVQSTGPARLRLSLQQCRQEMLPRDGMSPGHLAPPAAGAGAWWRAMTSWASANTSSQRHGGKHCAPSCPPQKEGSLWEACKAMKNFLSLISSWRGQIVSQDEASRTLVQLPN